MVLELFPCKSKARYPKYIGCRQLTSVHNVTIYQGVHICLLNAALNAECPFLTCGESVLLSTPYKDHYTMPPIPKLIEKYRVSIFTFLMHK